MTRQGFNPVAGSISDFIQFCERLESTEQVERTKESTTESTSTKKKGKRKRRDDADDEPAETPAKKGKKYCLKCGENPTHTTNGCWHLREYCDKPVNKQGGRSPPRGGARGKPKKTYDEEEINTLISQKLRSVLKLRPPKKEDGEVEEVDMEQFNYDAEHDVSDDE